MKIHSLIILHRKKYSNETEVGGVQRIIDHCLRDQYLIMHLWFGFIKFPFREKKLIDFNERYREPYRRAARCKKSWFVYESFQDAKHALLQYSETPRINYRGYTLTRCHGNKWVVLSRYKLRYYSSYWKQYDIAGELEVCKELIDEVISSKVKEYIKIY